MIMKFFESKIIYLLVVSIALLSCESEIDKVFFEGGTEPVLTSSSTDEIVLTKATEDYRSLQLQWTNPEYGFSNGVNTQDVFYTLQIDTVGSDFSNPKMNSLSFTKDLSTNFTVKDLNAALSALELSDYVPHNFEFRVKAALTNDNATLYSNAVQIMITTYLDVVYPVPDKLYITGAATPKGWMGSGDPAEPGQEFTKINAYTFEISSLEIKASSPFLFVPVYGNWDNKYGFTGEKEKNNPNGDSFKPGGEDFISPATAGTYKIIVNFKTGKYSFE